MTPTPTQKPLLPSDPVLDHKTRFALGVLSWRGLLLACMLLDFTLFIWVAAAPSWLRLAAATVFGVLTLALLTLAWIL